MVVQYGECIHLNYVNSYFRSSSTALWRLLMTGRPGQGKYKERKEKQQARNDEHDFGSIILFHTKM